MQDVINFMPVPIKSLQSIPLAALCVFCNLKLSKPGRNKGPKKNELSDDVGSDGNMTSKIVKKSSKDILGYTKSNDIDDSYAAKKLGFWTKNTAAGRPLRQIESICVLD